MAPLPVLHRFSRAGQRRAFPVIPRQWSVTRGGPTPCWPTGLPPVFSEAQVRRRSRWDAPQPPTGKGGWGAPLPVPVSDASPWLLVDAVTLAVCVGPHGFSVVSCGFAAPWSLPCPPAAFLAHCVFSSTAQASSAALSAALSPLASPGALLLLVSRPSRRGPGGPLLRRICSRPLVQLPVCCSQQSARSARPVVTPAGRLSGLGAWGRPWPVLTRQVSFDDPGCPVPGPGRCPVATRGHSPCRPYSRASFLSYSCQPTATGGRPGQPGRLSCRRVLRRRRGRPQRAQAVSLRIADILGLVP